MGPRVSAHGFWQINVGCFNKVVYTSEHSIWVVWTFYNAYDVKGYSAAGCDVVHETIVFCFLKDNISSDNCWKFGICFTPVR